MKFSVLLLLSTITNVMCQFGGFSGLSGFGGIGGLSGLGGLSGIGGLGGLGALGGFGGIGLGGGALGGLGLQGLAGLDLAHNPYLKEYIVKSILQEQTEQTVTALVACALDAECQKNALTKYARLVLTVSNYLNQLSNDYTGQYDQHQYPGQYQSSIGHQYPGQYQSSIGHQYPSHYQSSIGHGLRTSGHDFIDTGGHLVHEQTPYY